MLDMTDLNLDALSLAIATGLATVLILALKGVFALARRIAQKTPTGVDDKIIEQTEAVFKDKSKTL